MGDGVEDLPPQRRDVTARAAEAAVRRHQVVHDAALRTVRAPLLVAVSTFRRLCARFDSFAIDLKKTMKIESLNEKVNTFFFKDVASISILSPKCNYC